MKIVIAGVGYVGLSLAMLLAQNNEVVAVDIDKNRVDRLNKWKSPIKDEYIEKFLKEHAERNLNFRASTDQSEYDDADFIIIATPTNYDADLNYFDCTAVEDVISKCIGTNATIIIKSTIPVGYTEHVREKYNSNNIIFSPEFLRESKALYDTLYPSRIIVGCDKKTENAAKAFADLLVQGAEKEELEKANCDLIISTMQPDVKLNVPVIIVKGMGDMNYALMEYLSSFNFDCVYFFDGF